MTDRIFTDANGRKYINNEPRLHPPQRMPLTDAEIWEIHDACIPPTEGYVSPIEFARAVEAKLKEKNHD